MPEDRPVFATSAEANDFIDSILAADDSEAEPDLETLKSLHYAERERSRLAKEERSGKVHRSTGSTPEPGSKRKRTATERDTRRLVDTETATTLDPMPLTPLERQVAALYGITPVTSTSFSPLRSSDPAIDTMLRKRHHHIDDLATVKRNYAISGCPGIPAESLEDIIYIRFTHLEQLHPLAKPPNSDRYFNVSWDDSTGEVKLIPAGSKGVEIRNYATWITAWGVYKKVHRFLYPTRLSDLDAYQEHINECHEMWSWQVVYEYDKARRLYASDNPHVPLAQLVGSITSRYLIAKTAHSDVVDGAGTDAQRGVDREICRNWNRGRCSKRTNCYYLHECSRCGSANHPALRCP
ncbi:hypothetical protein HDU85_004213 [Gaertneriomyces sp. JEL0708]|nr:hypothetical protein HDU85_004213 [Gaertneriomyces sp. JEL0708]